jgi:hypothetical protein
MPSLIRDSARVFSVTTLSSRKRSIVLFVALMGAGMLLEKDTFFCSYGYSIHYTHFNLVPMFRVSGDIHVPLFAIRL